MNQETQLLAIQRHLAAGHTLTPLEALEKFNCMRLGARCWELKRAGWPVKTELVTVESGKRVARYSFQRGNR
jgi:hypothetical protein